MVTKENLSYSFASQLLNKSFDQIRYDMANPTPPTPKMDAGSRMEYVLKHGLDSLNLWTKTKTKGKEFDAHLKALQSELELYEAHPYLVVTETEHDACEMMVNHLREEVKFTLRICFVEYLLMGTQTCLCQTVLLRLSLQMQVLLILLGKLSI
jgi:hypothetical protein